MFNDVYKPVLIVTFVCVVVLLCWIKILTPLIAADCPSVESQYEQ